MKRNNQRSVERPVRICEEIVGERGKVDQVDFAHVWEDVVLSEAEQPAKRRASRSDL